jgi:hypothetical protein
MKTIVCTVIRKKETGSSGKIELTVSYEFSYVFPKTLEANEP